MTINYHKNFQLLPLSDSFQDSLSNQCYCNSEVNLVDRDSFSLQAPGELVRIQADPEVHHLPTRLRLVPQATVLHQEDGDR